MQAIVTVHFCMIGLPAGSRPQEFQTVQQQVRMHPMGPPGCNNFIPRHFHALHLYASPPFGSLFACRLLPRTPPTTYVVINRYADL